MAERKRKQYTPEFKAKVVLESLQGDTTIEEVRKKFGVSNSMIHRWREEYTKNLPLLFGEKHMNIPRPTTGSNPSNNLSCPHCLTPLAPQAVFCSSCGERVKKIGDWEIRTEDDEDDAQEADVDTVRMASISQKHLKRWQAFRSLKNTKAPERP